MNADKVRRMRMTLLLPACVMTVVVTSCGPTTPTTLYSWHNYEARSYSHVKNASDATLHALGEEYIKALDRQQGKRATPPPGMNADYALFLYKSDKKDEAVTYLKREIELYPESEKFLSKILNNIEKQK